MAAKNLTIPFFASIIAACLLLATGQAVLVLEAAESRKWQSTEGSIVYAGANLGTPFLLRGYAVEYEYAVGTKRFRNDRLQMGVIQTRSFFFGYGMSTFLEKHYPVGRKVNVFYRLDNPQDSVLEPGVTWSCFIFVPLILFLLLVAFYAC